MRYGAHAGAGERVEMGLPRAVQEAVEAADAMVEQMNGLPPGVTPPDGVNAPEVSQPVATQQPEQPVVPAADPPKDVDWEHKYRTLKGMFDAEVPRLHRQNNELREQLGGFQQQLDALKNAPPKVEKLITDQDRESFGPDLVSLVERGVREATLPLNHTIAQLQAENQNLRSQVGNVSQSQAQNADQMFYAELRRMVPDFEQLNTDPGLIAWLQEVDPVYGIPRQMGLDNAAERRDVQRAAAVFNAYKAAKAPANAPTAKQDLTKQVTPPRSRAAQQPVENQKLMWTQQSINAFYTDLRRGLIPTDEAARLEADLLAAVAEGRVQ